MAEEVATDVPKILADVAAYYGQKIVKFGTTPAGVDWKDENSQLLRFAQLFQLLEKDLSNSICDVGCGYAALLPYLQARGFTGHYTGLDCTSEQLEGARTYLEEKLIDKSSYELVQALTPKSASAYSVASGIFNVKMGIAEAEWHAYIMDQLSLMNAHSSKGFAFNCLTSVVDWRRDDLYYAEPAQFLAACRNLFAPDVTLLQDYGLYEFTIIVRKEP